MKVRNSVLTLAVSLVAGIGLLATLARAETYPARTITLMCRSRPGDRATLWRASSPTAWAAQLNATIIIENVGGAGGTLAPRRVFAGDARRLYAARRRHGLACAARC